MREEVESTDIGLEEDGSGWVLSVFRGDWPFFDGAEMLRVSAIWPNAVSPWCMHGRYTQYLCCMRGTVHLAMHDSREDRESHRETVTEYIGERSPRLVKVPPGVFFGSKNTGNGVALLAIASTGSSTPTTRTTRCSPPTRTRLRTTGHWTPTD